MKKIILTKWDKYQGRSDVKNPTWFACPIDFVQDEKFFDFSDSEIKFTLYLIGKGMKSTKRGEIDYRERFLAYESRVDVEVVKSAVKKLVNEGIIAFDSPDEPAQDPEIIEAERKSPESEQVCTDCVHDAIEPVKIMCTTGQDRTGQDRTGQDRTGQDIKPPARETRTEYSDMCYQVIDFLNTCAGKKFKHTKNNLKLVKAREREGYTLKDFEFVIRNKTLEWLNTDQEKYLRPETLFRPSKFESYVNAPEFKPRLDNNRQGRVIPMGKSKFERQLEELEQQEKLQ